MFSYLHHFERHWKRGLGFLGRYLLTTVKRSEITQLWLREGAMDDEHNTPWPAKLKVFVRFAFNVGKLVGPLINHLPFWLPHRMTDLSSFSPPARWELLNFKIALRASSFLFFSSSPPRLLASSPGRWSQWALLDLNCQLPIPVGAAGPQQPSPDICVHGWTSTANLSSPAGTAGTQPGTSRAEWAGTSRAQWALLDLNRGPPEPSGHC